MGRGRGGFGQIILKLQQAVAIINNNGIISDQLLSKSGHSVRVAMFMKKSGNTRQQN